MKLNARKKSADSSTESAPTVTNKVIEVDHSTVQIYHNQSVKQSHGWQSTECTYGVTFQVPNDIEAIEKGFKRATRIVEERLGPKIVAQQSLLRQLAAANRG